MKLTYDPTADAAYVRLSSEAVAGSEEIRPGVIFDFDAANRIVAIEFLKAKACVALDEIAPFTQ